MGKKYAVIGGGGSFGIHASLWLLNNSDAEKVIGVGRQPLRPEPFTLGIEENPRYEYYSYHLTYELDLMLEMLDREQPQTIINFAAQGEGTAS